MKKEVKTNKAADGNKSELSQSLSPNSDSGVETKPKLFRGESVPGNQSSPLLTNTSDTSKSVNSSEKSLYLKLLMDPPSIKRSLVRISHEILESNRGGDDLILLGLANGGIEISAVVAEIITQIENVEVPHFVLNASKFRDDFSIRGEKEVHQTDIAVSLEGKRVILIDDVLFTGRTVRSAFQALLEYGRPTFVKLAVLVDRGHREFPIRPDFVGKNIPTSLTETVTANDTGVWLEKFNG